MSEESYHNNYLVITIKSDELRVAEQYVLPIINDYPAPYS